MSHPTQPIQYVPDPPGYEKPCPECNGAEEICAECGSPPDDCRCDVADASLIVCAKCAGGAA